MANYVSYKKSLRKEKELYLELKKERKEFNRFTLTGAEAEYLVDMWNDYIRRFGAFRLCDLKPLVFNEDIHRFGAFRLCGSKPWVFNEDLNLTDIRYGWDHEISLKKDFIISVSHGVINCKLNLPAYKELD